MVDRSEMIVSMIESMEGPPTSVALLAVFVFRFDVLHLVRIGRTVLVLNGTGRMSSYGAVGCAWCSELGDYLRPGADNFM